MMNPDDLVVKLVKEFFTKEDVEGDVKSVLEKCIRLELLNLHLDKPRIVTDMYHIIDAETTLRIIREQNAEESN
jgi:hypothetical protein